MSSQANPYVLCSICNFSHNVGLKHNYTKRHKEKIKIILSKSHVKVKDTKKEMNSVIVHDKEWERNVTFWCYFCDAEFMKHSIHNELTIKSLGILQHLTDVSHYKSVKKFLKENRMTSERCEKYCIKKPELFKFLEKIPEAESLYLKKMELINQKFVDQIKEIDSQRQELLKSTSQVISSSTTSQSSENNPLKNKKRENFTKSSNESEMDKIPPWLMDDDDETSNNLISNYDDNQMRPSMEDLLKHKHNSEIK